jgi:hypothetical protein
MRPLRSVMRPRLPDDLARAVHALLGGQICKSPEQYKAWSQNLGHENVLTTFSSYGDVARHRQAEIIRGLGKSDHRAAVSPPV